MAFSAVGIRVRLFVFVLLMLVSGYQCISQFWYHAVLLLLVNFILGDSNCIFLQVCSPTNSALVFRRKVYEIALSEVLGTQMGVTEAQHKSQLV